MHEVVEQLELTKPARARTARSSSSTAVFYGPRLGWLGASGSVG